MCVRCRCGDENNRKKPTVNTQVRKKPTYLQSALSESEIARFESVVRGLSRTQVLALLAIQREMMDRYRFQGKNDLLVKAKFRGLALTSVKTC